ELQDIQSILTQAAQPGARVVADVRSGRPAGALDPTTPPWARGMKVARSAGPFLEASGHPEQIWVNLIPTPRLTAIVRDPGAQPVGLFPIDTPVLPGTRTLTLGAGSVWFPTALLASGAPANSWSGFRI